MESDPQLPNGNSTAGVAAPAAGFGAATTTIPSSKICQLAESLKLEHQFLRVHFEHYKKMIRANHLVVEKEVSAIISGVSEAADSDLSRDDAVLQLNSLVSRLQGLKRKYPDKPTRQQKKDVKELMAILSRMYPCKECADHFKEVLRANPVQAGSHEEFSQWLCHAHNVVNRSLGKLVFPCERVDARWGKLECEQRECDLLGTSTNFGKGTG
ncbi:unnamed protein product [Fraxinus pennsylvanica]|uniref:thiol oxidase n=1 Tax=Fraxinus pennsylvanica TaxID=56036 RepID=A0AAD1Z7R3_9LAMI|nr:unnamed protein product [Fraxinus pennsylvanica]